MDIVYKLFVSMAGTGSKFLPVKGFCGRRVQREERWRIRNFMTSIMNIIFNSFSEVFSSM